MSLMSCCDLPIEIYYNLIRYYLEPNEILSFASAGVSSRFQSLCENKRKWILVKSYTLIPRRCEDFFTNKHFSTGIETVDLTHCYWFLSGDLLESLDNLINLKELFVSDTQLKISHFLLLSQKCTLIEKLSINVDHKNWEDFLLTMEETFLKYNQNAKTESHIIMENSLKKLTHLKLCFNGLTVEAWFLVFKILRYSYNCLYLHLEVIFHDIKVDHWQLELEDNYSESSCNKLIANLRWMKSLQGIYYTKRGISSYSSDHSCFNQLFRWLFNELKPNHLYQLWLQSTMGLGYFQLNSRELCPSITHLCFGQDNTIELEALKELSHVGGVDGLASLVHLTNLKYVQGYCTSNWDLEQVCLSNPELEQLCFESGRHEIMFRDPSWKLIKLKSLVYICEHPDPDVVSRLIDASPNLKRFHVGRTWSSIFSKDITLVNSLQKVSCLKMLKTLTLSGFEFSLCTNENFFKEVFRNCTRLKCLHINGKMEENPDFYSNMCVHLPLAKSLKDFRLVREKFPYNSFVEVLNALIYCRRLERLVIWQDCWGRPNHNLSANLLETIVTKLTRLVVLHLVHPIAVSEVDAFEAMCKRKVNPSRPAFWYFLGDTWPPDGSVYAPRVHLDEIIQPKCYSFIPPKFVC